MKDLQYLSTECLIAKRERLLSDIKAYEDALKLMRSKLISLFYQSMIKSWKGEVHAIEAELKFRDEK